MNDDRGKPRPRVLHLLGLSALTIAILAPFAGKAFHIDDTLFLKAARHILDDPLDFYGFSVNWYFTDNRMDTVMMNPPLQSYWLAAVGGVLGFGEVALHLAAIFPAIAVTLGTYLLARRLCNRPLVAALAAILTPAFLVSANSVMCDVPMLALWVWSVYLWDVGLRQRRPWLLLAAAGLVAVCALTKYYGIALIPLLIAYSIAQRRSVGWWAAAMLVPIAALAAYEWLTWRMYGIEFGMGLLSRAFFYPAFAEDIVGLPRWERMQVGLAIAGGVATSLFFAWRLWSRSALLAGLALFAILALALLYRKGWAGLPLVDGTDAPRWGLLVQCALMMTAGLSVLALPVADLMRRRDAGAVLLTLWVLGTFAFSSVVNWSVTARTMMPMVPAIGIVIARRLEDVADEPSPAPPAFEWGTAVPLGLSACFAIVIAWADCSVANSARRAAQSALSEPAAGGAPIYFQGHWGFQHYMEAGGAIALDHAAPQPLPGDAVVAPRGNTNSIGFDPGDARFSHAIEVQPARWVSTLEPRLGASFYSSVFGPLPFAFGPAPPHRYDIYVVRRRLTVGDMERRIDAVNRGDAVFPE